METTAKFHLVPVNYFGCDSNEPVAHIPEISCVCVCAHARAHGSPGTVSRLQSSPPCLKTGPRPPPLQKGTEGGLVQCLCLFVKHLLQLVQENFLPDYSL